MGLTSTLAEVKGYYPARLTLKVDDILPAIEDAEEEYLVNQVLGRPFYDELVTAYQANSLDPDEIAVVNLCRRATVNLGLHHALSSLNVTLQSNGLGVVKNNDTVPASQARTNALKSDLLRAGFRGLDRLIAHLIENAEDFDSWTDDSNTIYTSLTTGLVRTTAEFEDVVRIGNSGFLFYKMRPTMRMVEEGPVAKVLCNDELYQDLLTKVLEEDLDEHETRVVKQASVAIAHLTMADSITKLSLTIDPSGAWSFSTLAGGETSGGPIPVDAKRLDALEARYRADGHVALERLKDLCQSLAAAGNLPLYAASSCYVDPATTPTEEDYTDRSFAGLF